MIRLACTFATTLALSACVTVEGPTPAEPQQRPVEAGNCDAAPAQRLLGTTATAASGADIQRVTGAGIFQWVPEGSAVTMDYREDRVRVSYDRAMAITAIRCG